MKTYLLTTGTVFGLLTLAHIWRMIVEPGIRTNPWHLLTTVLGAALAVWAWRLVRLSHTKTSY
jgi:hypothetical protein